MIFMLFCTLVIAMSEAKKTYVDLPPKYTSLMYEKAPACIAESGADPEILDQLTVWNFKDNEQNRKFNFCLFKNMGLSDEAGHFYVKKVLALFEYSNQKDEIAKISLECNKSWAEDPYKTMYKTLQCFNAKSPAYLHVKKH